MSEIQAEQKNFDSNIEIEEEEENEKESDEPSDKKQNGPKDKKGKHKCSQCYGMFGPCRPCRQFHHFHQFGQFRPQSQFCQWKPIKPYMPCMKPCDPYRFYGQYPTPCFRYFGQFSPCMPQFSPFARLPKNAQFDCPHRHHHHHHHHHHPHVPQYPPFYGQYKQFPISWYNKSPYQDPRFQNYGQYPQQSQFYPFRSPPQSFNPYQNYPHFDHHHHHHHHHHNKLPQFAQEQQQFFGRAPFSNFCGKLEQGKKQDIFEKNYFSEPPRSYGQFGGNERHFPIFGRFGFGNNVFRQGNKEESSSSPSAHHDVKHPRQPLKRKVPEHCHNRRRHRHGRHCHIRKNKHL